MRNVKRQSIKRYCCPCRNDIECFQFRSTLLNHKLQTLEIMRENHRKTFAKSHKFCSKFLPLFLAICISEIIKLRYPAAR